ncbi:MAG: hypothetical protein AAGC56_02445 [Pseudomonadota bacterium]
MLDATLLTLVHLLVFAYWLGGDIGAFYAAGFLTRDGVPRDRRLFAAKMLGDIDMAPRTAIILAFPTGFALAAAKGWITAPAGAVAAVAAGALAWLAVVWRLHLKAGADEILRTVDTIVRWSALVAIAGFGAVGLAGVLDLPLFVVLKSFALAVTIACGLAIRAVAAPLGPAFAKLAAGDDDDAISAVRGVMAKARPLVLAIWATLVVAAWLGIAVPT